MTTSHPRPILTLCHPDEVSGMTIFDDGTKACWGEGPGVEMQLVLADGTQTTVFEDSPYAVALENGIPGPQRAMTAAEVLEYDSIRG